MNKTYKINYLAKDFASIKNELKNYAKRYYSDNFADLSEASINSFMIDSVSYVGDMLSYYIDYQANESFLSTAIETPNIIALAKSMGYKQKNTSTTTGKVAMYMLIPAKTDGTPNYSLTPIIKKGTTLSSINGSYYLINEDIIIDQNLIGSNYTVAKTNDIGNPTYFAVKFYVPIISGQILTTTYEVGDFKKFNKIPLNDANGVEIISVLDSSQNEYFEVSNLAQNIVYKSFLNKDSVDSNARYVLKAVTAQRRFVTEIDSVSSYLIFGGKQYKPDEDLSINPIAEPSKFILNKYNNDYLSDSLFDPNHLLNGDAYGIGPDNTTLTITYRRNNTGNNNSNTGEVNSINFLNYEFITNVDSATQNTILSSMQVINEEPIVGDNSNLTIDEIKDLAGMIFQSQNRAVTAKDYEALSYSMPAKYGSIKRVKAERDPNSLKNNINIYTVCSDTNNFLVKSNTQIKQNLKTWISSYKLITDSVDIMDAKIINLGINFTILVDPVFNKIDIRNLAKEQLKFVYSTKPDIGQPFNILDVYRELKKVNGVLDITNVKIINLNGSGYSTTTFNIENNYSSDKNMIIMPKNAIYEIKYLDRDIIGNFI